MNQAEKEQLALHFAIAIMVQNICIILNAFCRLQQKSVNPCDKGCWGEAQTQGWPLTLNIRIITTSCPSTPNNG